jgi:arylsulfatase
VPRGGAEGMIVTQGGRFGGYGLYLSHGLLKIGKSHPIFVYNLLDLKRTVWSGPELKPGQHTIVFDFELDNAAPGSGGTGRLIVDGREVDKKRIENGTPIMFPEDETFDVGMDTRSGVARIEHSYEVPFEFTGALDKLSFDLGPYQFDPSKSK